jgi:hypothetical protein
MKHNSWLKALGILCILVYALPQLVAAEQKQYSIQDYHIYEPGPVEQSRLYMDGSIIELETGIRIYPVIGSDLPQVTPAQWREMALYERQAFENEPNKTVISGGRGNRGLDIVFNCANTPPDALVALESVASYVEQLFADNATVSININFAPLGPGILGMAQSYVAGNPAWNITRTSLVNDMDGDDSIQTWLPTGSTIPVRYTYGSATVIDEDRVYFLVAPYNAVIGNYPALAAQITFSTNFTWDYYPSNGVAGMCFQSVAAHEIGHVLGFVSNADGYSTDIDVLDLYRFQRSDGAGNYNPDSWSEFQTTARMVDQSSGIDDVNSDMIAVEYQMSDGSPYQASHFSQGNVDAIMQPAMSSGNTFYPNFFRVPDRDMFDAIGWDYIFNYYLTVNILGQGSVELDPDTVWHSSGTPVEVTAIPDSGWMFYLWGGSLTGNQNPDTVIMDYDKSITASFLTEYVTLTLTVNGSGTVNVDPNLPQYPRGTPVELTAIPDSAWVFSHWGGNLWGSQNPDTIIMDANKNVSATFVPDTYVEENKLTGAGATYFNITPNPTHGMTEIRYMIHDTGYTIPDVNLQVYDASGQLVKSLNLESSIMNHESTIRWDGTDHLNRKLGSGVYFVKFRAGDYKETQKLLLIR